MKTNYYTLDEAASFLTEKLDEKITPEAVLRFAASRESELDLCMYFHGSLEFQQENTKEGGLWPSFLLSDNFRGYIKIPVDAIHPDRDNFSPFTYARVIEELSNGLFTDPSAEKVLFPTLYARRIEPMDASSTIPFHPQDATTLNILLEPLAQNPIPISFEASRSESLIPEKSLLDFLKKNKKTEQPEPQAAESITKAKINESADNEELAALFDPVPVEALEKTFPAEGNWKKWVERAKRNGLSIARDGRAKFNPYQAGLWFIRRGVQGWDDARLYRVLSNILPARSKDKKHLLTGDTD